MHQDGVITFLTQDIPYGVGPTGKSNVPFQLEDREACPHMVLRLEETPPKLITSLLMKDETTKVRWKKLTDSYQKENVQSKLNLRICLISV